VLQHQTGSGEACRFSEKTGFPSAHEEVGLRETRAQQEDLGGLFAIPPAEVPGRERQEPWQSVETEIVNTQKAAEELARRLTDAGRFGLDVIGHGSGMAEASM